MNKWYNLHPKTFLMLGHILKVHWTPLHFMNGLCYGQIWNWNHNKVATLCLILSQCTATVSNHYTTNCVVLYCYVCYDLAEEIMLACAANFSCLHSLTRIILALISCCCLIHLSLFKVFGGVLFACAFCLPSFSWCFCCHIREL